MVEQHHLEDRAEWDKERDELRKVISEKDREIEELTMAQPKSRDDVLEALVVVPDSEVNGLKRSNRGRKR